MSDPAPLIVTADLDEVGFNWFETLRQAHFPSHRNKVPAHLTLFHALPGEHEQDIARTLRTACRVRSSHSLDVHGPRSLGRGVAYRLGSPDLEQLHGELAGLFSPWLTRQDRGPFRPHITIQNKVEPEAARRLLHRLEMAFEPFHISAKGLRLWRYLGGPWALVDRFAFAEASRQTASAPEWSATDAWQAEVQRCRPGRGGG